MKNIRTVARAAHSFNRGWQTALMCSSLAMVGACEGGSDTDGLASLGAPRETPLTGAAAAAENAKIGATDGEKTKDPAATVSSSLPAETLTQLREISNKVVARKISQQTMNSLADKLSAIVDQHDYLVALNAAIPAVEPSRSPLSTAGVEVTVGALSPFDYPAGCNNQTVQYTIVIQTGSVQDAGTDADVFLKLRGNFRGATAWTTLMTLDTPANDFERGSTFNKTFSLVGHGELDQINLFHSNNGNKPGWYVDTVTEFDSCSRRVYTSGVYTWLAVDSAPLWGTNYTGPISSESTF